MLNFDEILQNDYVKEIINSNEFYFQKGQDALNEWMKLEYSNDFKNRIILLSNNYDMFKDAAEKDSEIGEVLNFLFKIISYCDEKAKDKDKYNLYKNKRTLAKAAVRMNAWIKNLVSYKFNPIEVKDGSIKNAIDYLLKPEESATILSENHRELVVKNLF